MCTEFGNNLYGSADKLIISKRVLGTRIVAYFMVPSMDHGDGHLDSVLYVPQ